MPEISEFGTVVLSMDPSLCGVEPPLVHAEYRGFEADFNLRNGEVERGELTDISEPAVTEWIEANEDELVEMWRSGDFHYVPPLQ